jgi:hypothetical protein
MALEYRLYVPVDLAKKLSEKGISLDRDSVREMVTAYIHLKEAGISSLELIDVINFRNNLKNANDLMRRIFELKAKKNTSISLDELIKYGPYSTIDVIDEALTYYEYFHENIPLEIIQSEVNFVREIVKEYFELTSIPKPAVLTTMLIIVHRLAETKPEIIKDIFKKQWVDNYNYNQIIQAIDEYFKKL